ncbi:hypothetical protein COOONC_13470 [Cooperia oncophora]
MIIDFIDLQWDSCALPESQDYSHCRCALAFVYQAIAVVDKYYRMDKITDIQLKFDTARFRCKTLCNLNRIRTDRYETRTQLDVFESLMKKAASGGEILEDLKEAVDTTKTLLPPVHISRKRRGADSKGTFEPTPTESDKVCICAFDRVTHDAWPCHPKNVWQNTTCQFCDDHMFCQKYSKNGERQNAPCLCGNGEAFCMRYDRMAKLLNLWEFFTEVEKVTNISGDEIEALGFGDSADCLAYGRSGDPLCGDSK